MFKINRRPSTRYALTPKSRNTISRQSISKSVLNKSFKDYGRLTNKLSTEKINSFKRLTKQNIKELQLKRIKSRTQLNEAIKNATGKQQLDDKHIVYKNNVLPAIPDYKPVSKSTQENQQKNIQDLPKKVIESQQDMAKLFNQIMNGNQNPAEAPKKEQDNIFKQNLENTQKKIKTFEELQPNILEIIDNIKLNILDDIHINYIKYIEIINNLYFKFYKNNMVKSIIHRSIEKYNRQQIFKIPDDRLKDLIELVISYL